MQTGEPARAPERPQPRGRGGEIVPESPRLAEDGGPRVIDGEEAAALIADGLVDFRGRRGPLTER